MSEKEVSDWLLERDPARSVPSGGFRPRRARAVARTMRHPLLGWLWLHHGFVSRSAALLLVALAICFLLSIRAREKRTLPPVSISVLPPEAAEAPALETPPEDDADAGIPPPPSLDIPLFGDAPPSPPPSGPAPQ